MPFSIDKGHPVTNISGFILGNLDATEFCILIILFFIAHTQTNKIIPRKAYCQSQSNFQLQQTCSKHC